MSTTLTFACEAIRSRRRQFACTILLATLSCVQIVSAKEYTSGKHWDEPKVVTPPASVGAPPADAIVLFDGTDLAKWHGGKWIVKDGVATGNGRDIDTNQSFGNCQLHVEFATPETVAGEGQGRGNSGVYIMGKYEVQVLDSFKNKTYFDGQCAAVYKQHPPLVNVCRKPGEWQSYDIIFTAPVFSKDGKLTSPAFVTVLQNGVLVQNHQQLEGETQWDKPPAYHAHAAKLPLRLQYHYNPVRYRNVWIREL